MTVPTDPMETSSAGWPTRDLRGRQKIPSGKPMALSGSLAGAGQFLMLVRMCILTFFTTGISCLAEADGTAALKPVNAHSQGGGSHPFNIRVLAAIDKMPTGGGYAVTRSASKALGNAIGTDESGNLSIKGAMARPSFCSGAVYLVLLSALKPEIDAIRDPETRRTLISLIDVSGQADGSGIWGRWNSNGPCMAVTFAEVGLGRSSWGFKSAVPGDFLKLWWTESIGRDEAGHSVVFLGFKKTESGEDGIEFWSSNKPGGYGKKVISLSKIKHALVSRCERPERVAGLLRLGGKNDYLAGMLKRNTSHEEIDKRILPDVPIPTPTAVR